MSEYVTEQENFWAGQFGNDYSDRNNSAQLLSSNLALFSRIMKNTRNVGSIIEFGANIGMNLRCLKQLMPDAELSAVEINEKAVSVMRKWGGARVYHESILGFEIDHQRDFALSKGVLIHIDPDYLDKVYDVLYKSSKKYICIAEYYNSTPAEVIYRGHRHRLFKRDFAGDLLNRYDDLAIIDYGFAYHRDPAFPQDDITWFLLEKT